jgi:hypothetical protein
MLLNPQGSGNLISEARPAVAGADANKARDVLAVT